MTPPLPLFGSVDLAARIERAEARFMEEATAAIRSRRETFAIPIAGGVATWAGLGVPMTKLAGLGFAGVPEVAALEAVERAFDERRTPLQVELSNLAEPAVGALLTGRGYRLTGFENVLALRLPAAAGGPRVAPGVEVSEGDDGDLEAWVDAVTEGFARPDDQGVPSTEAYPRQMIEDFTRDLTRVEDLVRYTARLTGNGPIAGRAGPIAGGASLRIWEGVAHLAGAATRPAYRRRGVQTSLLAVRLSRAAQAGCDVAVVTTQPGSKSQQNVQRQGFDLLYTRAVLVRER